VCVDRCGGMCVDRCGGMQGTKRATATSSLFEASSVGFFSRM